MFDGGRGFLRFTEFIFKLLKITLINNGGFGASALDNIIKALNVLSSRRET